MAEKNEDIERLKSLQQAYNKTFESEEGRKVLTDLYKICFKNSSTINEMSHIMFFNEGHRAVLLHIETMMKMNLYKLKEMQDEQGQS